MRWKIAAVTVWREPLSYVWGQLQPFSSARVQLVPSAPGARLSEPCYPQHELWIGHGQVTIKTIGVIQC